MDLDLSPRALKQLAKIGKKDQDRVERKFSQLGNNPYAGKPLRGKFAGQMSLKAWPLRIIYRINTKKVIEILDVDYRGGVYKD